MPTTARYISRLSCTNVTVSIAVDVGSDVSAHVVTKQCTYITNVVYVRILYSKNVNTETYVYALSTSMFVVVNNYKYYFLARTFTRSQ